MRITLLCKILIVGVCSFAASACSTQADQKFEFYYYPARNVYYDLSNSRYIYSLNGGKTWDTLYKKMDSEPATLGKKQIIYSRIANPWDSNAVHINRYGGILLDVPDVDSNAVRDIVVAERKSTVKTKPAASSSTGNDNKAGKKPGFFKRLFGKKH